jgi:hypothetical protein
MATKESNQNATPVPLILSVEANYCACKLGFHFFKSYGSALSATFGGSVHDILRIHKRLMAARPFNNYDAMVRLIPASEPFCSAKLS